MKLYLPLNFAQCSRPAAVAGLCWATASANRCVIRLVMHLSALPCGFGVHRALHRFEYFRLKLQRGFLDNRELRRIGWPQNTQKSTELIEKYFCGLQRFQWLKEEVAIGVSVIGLTKIRDQIPNIIPILPSPNSLRISVSWRETLQAIGI